MERSKPSISIHEHGSNTMKTTFDSRNKQYTTDVIILKEGYAMSIILPDQGGFMIDEPWQVAEEKILQNKVPISLTYTILSRLGVVINTDDSFFYVSEAGIEYM